jgi:DNA-binding NarL/FixJ family response regulator
MVRRPAAPDDCRVTSAERDTTILLVEDHLALRKGLELLLRARGFHVVGAGSSPEEGYRLFSARRPDVAVIDVGLGDGSGVQLAERILATDPEAGVLMYTGTPDPEAVDAAAHCGARGFALKSRGPDDLMRAIRAVAAGGVYVDPVVATLLAPSAAPARVLTDREREILSLLATGLTGEQVAAELFLSPETIRTHIRNAMRKLGAHTRVHAVALAVRQREISL